MPHLKLLRDPVHITSATTTSHIAYIIEMMSQECTLARGVAIQIIVIKLSLGSNQFTYNN